jgi:hypothetical protein
MMMTMLSVAIVSIAMTLLLPLIAAHPNANVETAIAKSLQNDTFLFTVTIDHEDEIGTDHYCDGWSVYSDDGKETLFTSPGGSRDGPHGALCRPQRADAVARRRLHSKVGRQRRRSCARQGARLWRHRGLCRHGRHPHRRRVQIDFETPLAT